MEKFDKEFQKTVLKTLSVSEWSLDKGILSARLDWPVRAAQLLVLWELGGGGGGNEEWNGRFLSNSFYSVRGCTATAAVADLTHTWPQTGNVISPGRVTIQLWGEETLTPDGEVRSVLIAYRFTQLSSGNLRLKKIRFAPFHPCSTGHIERRVKWNILRASYCS